MSAFTDFLDTLPELGALRIVIVPEGVAGYRLDLGQLRELLGDPRYVWAMCLADRPGMAYFQRYLEYTHFRPGTPMEPALACLWWKWKGMTWSFAGVPRAFLDLMGGLHDGEAIVREAAGLARLRVSASIPAAMESGGSRLDDATAPSEEPALFKMGFVEPELPWSNILYLENAPGHLCYRDQAAAFRQQDEDIARLMESVGL